MAPTMSKSVILLEINGDADVDDMIAFQAVDEESGLITTSLLIDKEEWEHFGSPDVVTITIEPGDQLNLPGVYAPGEVVDLAVVRADTIAGKNRRG